MQGKIFIKIKRGLRTKVKVRVILLAPILMVAMMSSHVKPVEALGCPDVRVVFARGSGGERWKDANYLAYKSAI